MTDEPGFAPAPEPEAPDIYPEDLEALNLHEEGWIAGNRAAWRALLSQALRELGYQGTEAEHTKWIAEREDVTALLRRLCAEHGDNDWTNDLHLNDVIEKHLFRHIEFDTSEDS